MEGGSQGDLHPGLSRDTSRLSVFFFFLLVYAYCTAFECRLVALVEFQADHRHLAFSLRSSLNLLSSLSFLLLLSSFRNTMVVGMTLRLAATLVVLCVTSAAAREIQLLVDPGPASAALYLTPNTTAPPIFHNQLFGPLGGAKSFYHLTQWNTPESTLCLRSEDGFGPVAEWKGV